MRFLFSFFFIIQVSLLYCQNFRVSDWKNYTDQKNVKDFIFSGEDIWSATSGGAFNYNISSKQYKSISNIEGLFSVDITSIAVDSKGRIWFGNSNGFIDIYNIENNSWSHLSDIYYAPGNLKKNIYAFLIYGDSVYIATDFGVSLFDLGKNYFLDTYQKFGRFPSATRVNSVKIFSGKIWVATPIGVAVANLSSKNLLSPDEWTNFDQSNNLVSNNVTSVEVFKNTVYISSDSGIFKFNGSKFVATAFQRSPVTKIFSSGDYLYFSSFNNLYKMDQNGSYSRIGESLKSKITSINIDRSGKPWVGLENNGLAFLAGAKWDSVEMNSPNSNFFRDMVVEADGSLWAASGGINGNGRGFYKLKNGIWINYTKEKFPVLKSDDYICLAITPDNSIWAGSYGSGLAQIKDTSIKLWNETNTNNVLYGAVDSWYVCLSKLTVDNSGNLWGLNYQSMNNLIVGFKNGSKWEGYKNAYNANATTCWDITVDDLGTKWFIASGQGTGLYYFNENYKIGNANDYNFGFLSFDEIVTNFSSPVINCLKIDKENQLWMGTNHGVSYISNPRSPLSSSPIAFLPCYTQNCNITGQVVNCIAIDALNNKWIGTKSSGVWVLNPNGYEVLAQYNTQNSKIIDDDIKSIAIDNSQGIVYIGTEKGLTSFKTILVEPLPEFSDKLIVSPNPFIPGENTLIIDGLVESSSLKILTINGKLISQFKSPGGRIAYWDGKDDNGNYVSSGVYIVVAYTNTGNKVSLGKIAVVRK